ncbi:MAG: FAD-dependent oxidoreductase [Acidobacteriota bacterium]|nr:FAD-dependent oxidoreductase [Acidobacteriota bacterium]
MRKSHDVAVIGAGVFGAWTAWHLRQAGLSVALLDAHGAANSRASSGGESRLIRMGYGPDELYTRWSLRSLHLWKQLFRRIRRPLFHPTGVLWLASATDSYTAQNFAVLQRAGIPVERLSRSEIRQRFPQFSLTDVSWALFEPASGVLMARQAVQALVAEGVGQGIDSRIGGVLPPAGSGRLRFVKTEAGERVAAAAFVFACGPWLPQLFPRILGHRIFPTRQEVFFFGPPPGSQQFAAPHMPGWLHHGDEVYGTGDLENRGVKIAVDFHGPAFNPETGKREVSAQGLRAIRRYLARRLPALKDAPLVESRVCQYENTANGDFLIDCHPDYDNVLLAGGGSGHGFKHGPALGEYVARLLTRGGPVEPRFSLASKGNRQARSIY